MKWTSVFSVLFALFEDVVVYNLYVKNTDEKPASYYPKIFPNNLLQDQ